MERIMSGPRCRAAWLAVLLCLAPVLAHAQQAQPAAPSELRPWIAVGGSWTTMLGDCTNCEIANYLHSGGVMGNVGFSLNSRADLGGEIFWVPQTLTNGDEIRVTYLLAATDFRPWRTKGFFLKAGVGMAFMTNWLKALDDQEPPVRSKAFALELGAGWEWTLHGRFGGQVWGTQHAAALGDLQLSDQVIQNVMGNFWSVGAGIVIR
jgi:hypothetical protein